MAKFIRLAGLVALAVLVSGLARPEALAAAKADPGYEVIELHSGTAVEKRSAPWRVAVIVLAYNDHWTSWTGSWLYEGALRAQLAKRYMQLYVVRGRKLTVAKIQNALRAALETGTKVDFMTNTHSSPRAIKLNRNLWATPEQLIRPVLAETGSVGQLDFAANFGCYSNHQAQDWTALGFRSYVGHEGVSAGVVAMSSYLKNWVRHCETVTRAVADTNGFMNRFFNKNPIAKAIFKVLGGGRYTAVMMSFGENQSFCD